MRELRRVSRGPVVLLTFDARVSSASWLVVDYLPELGELDLRIFPPELLSEWLGGETEIVAVPIHRDTPDWTTGAFWAHPERVLDAEARAATSGFARMSSEVDARVEQAVRADLERGRWDARHGHLRQLDEYDAGMLLIVSRPG